MKDQTEIDCLIYKKESEYGKRRTQDIAIERHEIDWQEVQRTVVNSIFNQNASAISYKSVEEDSVYQLSTNNWLSQNQFDSSCLDSSNIDRPIYFLLLLFSRSQYGTDIEAEAEAETIFDINVRSNVSILFLNNFCRRIRALEVQ